MAAESDTTPPSAAAMRDVIERVYRTPGADQPWLDQISRSIDVAENPDAVSDADKLRAVATHFDLHDRQAADAGEPVHGTQMQDFLRGLADRLDAAQVEWVVRTVSNSGQVDIRYDDEVAARRGVDQHIGWFLGTDATVHLMQRRLGAWIEVTR